jgi:hypothetical protein
VRVTRPHDPYLFLSSIAQLTKRPRIGSGGLSVAQQLYNRFQAAGKPLKAGDIGIVDAAEYHNYQVGVHNSVQCLSNDSSPKC